MSELVKIELKMIKAIESFELDFSSNRKLVLLIGHNNVGKTSILEAIKFFFSSEQKADELWPLNEAGNYKELEEDPYILVEIKYTEDEINRIKDDLSATHQDQTLDNFLINGNALIIRKSIHKTAKTIKAKEYVFKRQDNDNFENFTGLIQNTARLIPRYIYLQSQASLDDYISATQKAEHTFEELFGLYFEGLKWEENEQIKELISKLINKINELIGIAEIKQKLEDNLKELDNISVEKLDQGFQDVSDVANIIKKVKISLNDGVISDARLKGSGIQRGLIFSLLRLIAEKRKDERNKDTIFLIDEPDLHLHPQLQKQIKNIIDKLSVNYPVVVSTHSHLMIGKKIPTIGKIMKIYKENNIVKSEDISDEKNLFKELFTYLGYLPSDFMLPDNIILVEGKFDKKFLEKLVDLIMTTGEISSDLLEFDISIIDIGGDGQLKKAFNFLTDLSSAISFFEGIPAYKNRFCCIFDSSKSSSLIDLRNKANDIDAPHRIVCLSKNGIEHYYPQSLLFEYGKSVQDIQRNVEEKRNAAEYMIENIKVQNLTEIDSGIKDLIKLSFQKSKII